MKALIITFALLVGTYTINAQEEKNKITDGGTTITVTVPTKTMKGTVYVALHTVNTFMKAAPLATLKATPENGKATVTFENIATGTYGITLFLDTNGNGTMDFEANGMPKEMYGVSNNVMNFGPPQWSDAKFEVTTTPINMEIIL